MLVETRVIFFRPWHGNLILFFCNDSHLVISIIWNLMPLQNVKIKLDFANHCLYRELDKILHCFIFYDVWELFCVSTSHKTTIVRNSFSAVVYNACNITHTVEKPITVISVSSENFLLLLFKFVDFCVKILYIVIMLYWVYIPFYPEWHFLQPSQPLQSQRAGLLLT